MLFLPGDSLVNQESHPVVLFVHRACVGIIVLLCCGGPFCGFRFRFAFWSCYAKPICDLCHCSFRASEIPCDLRDRFPVSISSCNFGFFFFSPPLFRQALSFSHNLLLVLSLIQLKTQPFSPSALRYMFLYVCKLSC